MASNIENKQSLYHQPQPQQRPPSASSVCTENVSEICHRSSRKNILKNTADIILPIIKRKGDSLPRSQRDLKSGNYLGPPDLVKSTTKRRGSSADSSRRPSITTFLEEEMKPSSSKPIFYTPQLQRKSLNTSGSTLASGSVEDYFATEDNGGVYLGPSEDKNQQKVEPKERQTHPFKVLKRQETKMSIVCSMLGYLPQREFVETGYDPTEVVLRQRLESVTDSPGAKCRPSLTSAVAIAPTFKTAVASVLVRQDSSQSVGTNPRKSMCPC